MNDYNGETWSLEANDGDRNEELINIYSYQIH